MNRAIRAFKLIFFQGNFHRIWQILNKSPLISIVSLLKKTFYFGLWKKRTLALKQFPLDAEQTNLLKYLNENGYVRVDSLLSADDFIGLKKYLEQKLAKLETEKSHQSTHTKDFWFRLSDSDLSHGMTSSNPIAEISLKPTILTVASHYLAQAAFLQSVLLTYSVPSEGELKASQLWHQDHDNDRMLKFFIYLSDVTSPESGPFTLVPRRPSSRIKNSFFPRHISDNEIQKFIQPDEVIQLKGKQWSAFLCDTSRCYHMGSRVAAGHSRLMTTSIYLGLPSVYPNGNCSSIRATGALNSQQMMALIP
jgi:hypothetical protein